MFVREFLQPGNNIPVVFPKALKVILKKELFSEAGFKGYQI